MSPHLPPLEMECMKVLWKMPAATVAQVRSALPRALAYTTVMTVLDRMSAKGVIERRKAGRAYVYSARLDLDSAREAAVKRLIDNLFEHDREALLRYISRTRTDQSAGAPSLPARRRAGRTREPEVFVPQMDETLL